MLSLGALVVASAVAASPSPAPAPPAPMRLRGLDRLYFTLVGGIDRLIAPPSVGTLLPPVLQATGGPPKAEVEASAVTDCPLPLPAWPRHVLLPPAQHSRHARRSELWLALYDGGRRLDVRQFQ